MNETTKLEPEDVGRVASNDLLEGRMDRLGQMAWSRSITEELLFLLYSIATILSFGFGFDIVGWIFIIKTGTTLYAAIFFAIKEAKAL